MRAVVLKDKQNIKVENIAKPSADNEFLLVKPYACGICGSDIRYYNGENPWALHTIGKSLPNPPNIILGHEFAGIVEEVVNPEYKHLLGKRVGILAFKTCGICNECVNGHYNSCHNTQHLGHGAGWGKMEYYPGGMADYCRVWNSQVVELPDDISFREATLLDPISVGIHAITLSNVNIGDNVLVLGSGPIGLSIAQAIKGFGANKVITTDLSSHSLKLAEKLGIDRTVNVNEESVEDALNSYLGKNVNVVFDTIGSEYSQKLGLKVLAESGTMVNLVANNTKSSYSLIDLAGEKRIISSANNRSEDYLMGIDFIQNGIINANDMITHILPLNDVQKGIDMLIDRESSQALKVVLDIN